MKNFRKVLALVLAVATLMSFAAMASAATVNFTDAGEITKAEAVDVLVALGVINGYTDGSFGPKGDVTRAEMATMISKLMNSGEDVNARWTNANTFADMAGVEWAAGHVAFNASEGYIAGRNATTFAPNDKVTGAEAAKMLLCALGYDATYNGLVGADWSKNTVKLASKLGLFENVDSKPEEALNRENAAQVLLNALQAPTVEFKAGSTSTIGGVTVVTGGEQEDLTNNFAYYTQALPTDTAAYLIETLFDAATKEDDTDWAGRKAFTWYYGGKIGTYGTGEIYKTYTGALSLAALYTDLGEVDGTEFNTINAYLNGAAADDVETAVTGMTKYSTARDIIAAPGTTTEVYYDRLTKALDIVTIQPYFGVIETVDEDAEEAEVYVNDDFRGTLEDVAYTEEDEETPVIAYVSEKGIDPELISVEKATVVTGTLTNAAGAAGTDLVLTVDGTVYTVSAAALGTANVTNYLGSKVTMYTDKNGVVVNVEAADVSADLKYAYVIATGSGDQIYQNGADKYAYLLFADGTHASAQLKANDFVTNNWATLEGTIVGYSVKDGIYTLKTAEVGAITSGSVSVVNTGAAAIDTNVKATNNSVFVVDLALDADYQNQITIASSVYTGIKNVPNIEATNIAYLADGYGSVIIAFANDAELTMGYTADVDAIYVTGTERVEAQLNADEELVSYIEYKAIVDGAVTSVKVDTEGDAYTKVTGNAANGWVLFNGETIIDGVYSDINIASQAYQDANTISAAGWEKYKDGVIYDGTQYVAVEEDTVAYIYNAKTLTLSVSTVAKIGSRLSTSGWSFYLEDTTAIGAVQPVVAVYACING